MRKILREDKGGGKDGIERQLAISLIIFITM